MNKWKKAISRPFLQWMANRGSPVRFHHFWDFDDIEDLWFYRFIRHRGILDKAKTKRIDFYSVFGPRPLTKWLMNKEHKSIFFTGENLDNYPAYADRMLREVDLSIGFEYLDHPKYFRFPLWLLYIIKPEWGLPEIRDYITRAFNQTEYRERPGFCCLVASHDRNGIRRKMMNEVAAIGPVTSAGKIYNNSNALKVEFGNDKSEFIKQFKLNICPENSNAPGYVTEKVIQALEAGCIPLYWGNNNQAEPKIVNQETIWYFDQDPDTLMKFRERLIKLKQDPGVYRDWCKLPRFLPGAAEIISEWMDQLEERIIRAPASME